MSVFLGEAEPLWRPAEGEIAAANLTRYMTWLRETRGLDLHDYGALHAWSVDQLEDFWASLYDYFEIESPTPYARVLSGRAMPGARWFDGARVNFARHVLRAAPEDRARPALFAQREGEAITETSWGALIAMVEAFAGFLRARGIKPGDRVAAYVSNTPEAVAAFLACAAVGAVWSSVSPEFGVEAVRDRFVQLEPKALIAVDGYHFGGKAHDRTEAVRGVAAGLPSLDTIVHIQSPLWRTGGPPLVPGAVPWKEALAAAPPFAGYADVDFSAPLFVAFSSGTTGLPKAIVHGHGGITLEALKLHHLHDNQTPDSRTLFFTTTGWIVWFGLVTSLMTGGAIALYDGHPAAPDPLALWRFASAIRATSLGASPALFTGLMRAGAVPNRTVDVTSVKTVGLTGSPATPELMRWAAEACGGPRAHIVTMSGGADVFTAFVGGCPIRPAYAGEFQGPLLGVDAVALSEDGRAVIGDVGELVIRQPMPTMPLGFLHDPDGARLRASYFDMFPGLWRQGDFFLVNARGGSFILGRSDSTLNRHGVRIGAAEIYRILESIEGVADSLVVNLELADGGSYMPLFITLEPGHALTADLAAAITERLRREGSPRHAPDEIHVAPAVPYTISGKKLEAPVKKILMGRPPEAVANRGAMRNPEALDFYIAFRERVAARAPNPIAG